MTDICAVCGLPKDLCVCSEIEKEQQRIRVRLETRKWGREMTIIEGINSSRAELQKIAQKLKTLCACGGTAKNNQILLQGDHRKKAKELLVSLGFPESQIEVQ